MNGFANYHAGRAEIMEGVGTGAVRFRNAEECAAEGGMRRRRR